MHVCVLDWSYMIQANVKNLRCVRMESADAKNTVGGLLIVFIVFRSGWMR